MFPKTQRLKLFALLLAAQAGCVALGLWIHHRLAVSAAVQRARNQAVVNLASEVGDRLVEIREAHSAADAARSPDAATWQHRLGSRPPGDHVAWLLLDRQWHLSEIVSDEDRVASSESQGEPAQWAPIPAAPPMGSGLHAGTLAIGGRSFVAVAVDLPHGAGVIAAGRPEECTVIASARSAATPLATLAIAWVWTTGLLAIVVYLIVTKVHDELARRHAESESDSLRRIQSLVRTRDALIYGLASVAESRDEITGRHVERVAFYAARLATAASQYPRFRHLITPEFVQHIAISAVLHDIGKVGIEDSILFKPGKLSEAEWKRMKGHTTIGGRYLSSIEQRLGTSPTIRMAREIAVHHHEHWDGTGYPDGLAGDDIPLSARIVAIADVYEALTSVREYKPPFPHEKCLEIVRSERGGQFDPDLVDAFVKIERTFRQIACEYGEHVFSEPAPQGRPPETNPDAQCIGLVSTMKELENWSVPSTHPAAPE